MAAEYDQKGAASARCVGYFDTSVMCGNDIVGDGETQPEVIFVTAGFFAAIKAVKYFGLILVADTDTRVRNFDFKVFVHVIGRQTDFSARRRIADGIVQKDCEHLCDALTVTYAVGECIFGEGGADLDIL